MFRGDYYVMDNSGCTSCFMASWFYHYYRRFVNTHIVGNCTGFDYSPVTSR